MKSYLVFVEVMMLGRELRIGDAKLSIFVGVIALCRKPKDVGMRSCWNSFGKVNVAVDMVFAEAVVTHAFGTVTEFKIRIIRIRAAADGAFMPVKAGGLFPPDLLCRALEVDCGGALFIHTEHAEQIVPAEEEEVQDGHQRKQICWEGQREDAKEEEDGIYQRKPLHFDRDDKEQQHLHIREEGGKREEHGEIDILRRKADCHMGNEIHQEAVDDGEENAREEIDVEPGCPPLALKRGADKVVKIKSNESEKPGARRDEHK